MMKNKDIIFICIALITRLTVIHADHVITFFIRPYPHTQESPTKKSKLHKIHIPGKVAKYHLKKLHQEAPITGIFCTYAGFLSLSNGIGQVTFPLKHNEPKLSIIITDKIHPMLMAANTIHHWEIPIDDTASQFDIERKEDEETGLTYWDIRKQTPPANRIIPTQSILLFAKPNNFFIPEGISLTSNGPNLVLPTIYARRSIDIATNAIHALAIRQFFDSVRAERKLQGKMYQIHEVY